MNRRFCRSVYLASADGPLPQSETDMSDKIEIKITELSIDALDGVSGGGIVGDFNTVIQAIGHAVSELGSLAHGNIPVGTGSGAGSGSGFDTVIKNLPGL